MREALVNDKTLVAFCTASDVPIVTSPYVRTMFLHSELEGTGNGQSMNVCNLAAQEVEDCKMEPAQSSQRFW